MDISVVVPLFNEEESIPELFAWIERVMKANGFSYEVIFVNDGSVMLHEETETLREKYGKSIDAIFREEFRC